MTQRFRFGKRKVRKGRVAAALALAVLLGFAPAQQSHADFEGDMMTGGQITVTIEEGKYAELDAIKDDVVLDVYKVASGEKMSGFDTYKLNWSESPFASLQSDWDAMIKLGDEGSLTADDVIAMTQKFAEVVLDGNVGIYRTEEAVTPAADAPTPAVIGTLGTPITDLYAGLYLIIPHDGSRPDYLVKNEDGGNTVYSTVADGNKKYYQFAPILVSIPTRTIETLDEENAGVITTVDGYEYNYSAFSSNSADDAGTWSNEINIAAKVGEGDLTGSLRIKKSLPVNETLTGRIDPATFVFNIVGKLKGETVYTNVASLKFKAYSDITEQEIVIDDLPIGTEITVTENYAGNYKPVEASKTVTIQAKNQEVDMVEAEFENTYDGRIHGGGSVTNSFSIDQEKAEWSWDKELATEDKQGETKQAEPAQAESEQ